MDIQQLRSLVAKVVCLGSHPPIIQSMLDFDFLSGKEKPSIVAIVAGGRRFERYFYGKKQILIPVFSQLEAIPADIREQISLFFNTTSARRAKQSTIEALTYFPNIIGGTIFAEDIPEQHALELHQFVQNRSRYPELVSGSPNQKNEMLKQVQHNKERFIIGPASVGLLIPGNFKIGAIGGTDYRQLLASDVMTSGNVAVFSASGGMVGEIIRVVSQQGKHLSFSLSFGGDRFPVMTPKEAFLAAQEDPNTSAIVYYGELGGTDEYDLVELLESKKVTKQVICYIAGTVSDLFETPPQFGHAKAMAKSKGESAREKRDALKKAGALVGETFVAFVEYIKQIPAAPLQNNPDYTTMIAAMNERTNALITTSISSDHNGDATILSENLLDFVKARPFASIVASLFLGKKEVTKDLEEFVDFVLRLLVDHGPYVSGAMNTIITARAGRDLVSSLATGLLTIGPRFGGAINQAAANWYTGVTQGKSAYDFVEEFAAKKVYISGIGHRKYRVDLPDPRVQALLEFASKLEKKRFTSFALEVQKITTAKKGNLILNVDGVIAAILLDMLSEKESLSDQDLLRLTEIEFFNALFVLSRSVGFISHFLDQKRLDEGLFRLPDDLVLDASSE